jgi:hypothetical protein
VACSVCEVKTASEDGWGTGMLSCTSGLGSRSNYSKENSVCGSAPLPFLEFYPSSSTSIPRVSTPAASSSFYSTTPPFPAPPFL